MQSELRGEHPPTFLESRSEMTFPIEVRPNIGGAKNPVVRIATGTMSVARGAHRSARQACQADVNLKVLPASFG